MPLQIGPLPTARIADAVAILGRAFMTDPIFSYLFPDPSRRSAVFAVFFGMLVNTYLRFGHVYGAQQDGMLSGVAVWRPPNAGALSEYDKAVENEAAMRVRAIDSTAAEEMFAGFARAETDHPTDPHWYLFFVGVEPALQGRGIGEQLLVPVLRAADAQGTVCYLETPFPRTHAFYRRLGFEVKGAGHPFADAPPLWTMLRKPAG
jgi:ribosomal protein S18 acetylase RimI-like enzyme